MSFRFYSNMVSEASKKFAAGAFITGLMLIGFGILIIVMKDIFAMLAAGIFFIAGIGCAWTAVKVYFGQRRFSRMAEDEPTTGRENVRIHQEHIDV